MVNSIINKFGKYIGVDGTFASWFVLIGICTQLFTCYLTNDTALAVCSGIAGVVSVVLCSQKKMSFYFWGILQLVTILTISYQTELFGKVLENAFYILTMFVGLVLWNKHQDGGKTEVRSMTILNYVSIAAFAPLLAWGVSLIVLRFNSDQLILDTLTTTIGIIAQLMMVFRFKEQWWLWLTLDILCIILWAKDENWCLMVQYIFWAVNCIYGIYKWW